MHEASSFNTNVPGQAALARVMDKTFNEPYEGHANYLDYSKVTFQHGRDACIEMLEKSTGIRFKATHIESGYFLPVDVSGTEDKIPAKYFVKNVNYEEKPDEGIKVI